MPSFTTAAYPCPTRGPTCALEGIGAACAAFPDIRITINDLFAADDKVVLRWSSHGTHRGELQGIPAANRPMTMTGIAIYRFADGKIVEEWMNNDTLGVLRQLRCITRIALAVVRARMSGGSQTNIPLRCIAVRLQIGENSNGLVWATNSD